MTSSTGATLTILQGLGVQLIALRCAGYNQVDLKAANELGLLVVRVPEYSPYAVAEHAVALLLALNRKLPRAYNRVRESNFSLEGLVGFDLHGQDGRHRRYGQDRRRLRDNHGRIRLPPARLSTLSAAPTCR